MIRSIFDHINLPIKTSLRIIFGILTSINLGITIWFWFNDSKLTDWDWVYEFGFLFSAACTSWLVYKPRIGTGSIFLLPTLIFSFIRVIDLLQNYWIGDNGMGWAVFFEAVIWSGFVIFVAYIDILESQIYHRIVEYESNSSNRRTVSTN